MFNSISCQSHTQTLSHTHTHTHTHTYKYQNLTGKESLLVKILKSVDLTMKIYKFWQPLHGNTDCKSL